MGTMGTVGIVPIETGTVIGDRPATGAGLIVSVVPGPIEGLPWTGGKATSFSEKVRPVMTLPPVIPCTDSFGMEICD
jgi:hypothetical protein